MKEELRKTNPTLNSRTPKRKKAKGARRPTWPRSWPTVSRTAAEKRDAFALLSSQAFANPTEDALPTKYEAQQRQLEGSMALINAQFSKLLRFYALRHARDAFEPTEQLSKATLTQLNFEGLTIECVRTTPPLFDACAPSAAPPLPTRLFTLGSC